MKARLLIELKTSNGKVVATRQAHNAVMRSGAELVAHLFMGKGQAISHMGVGTSDTPETSAYNTPALTNPAAGNPGSLTGNTWAAIKGDDFSFEIDDAHRVCKVQVRGTLAKEDAVGTVKEAGLLSRGQDGKDILYNRVTFAPLIKGSTHELTMYWEVSFPYGDLQ